MTEEQLRERLMAGEPLFMELRDGVRQWWVDGPFEAVPAAVAMVLMKDMAECGDSLFGERGASQTWRMK